MRVKVTQWKNQMQTKIINRESLVKNSEVDLLWKKLLETLKMRRVSKETPLSRQHQSQLASNSRPQVAPMEFQSRSTRSSADLPFQIVAVCQPCLPIWPKTLLYTGVVWLHPVPPNSNLLSRLECTLQTRPRPISVRDCPPTMHPLHPTTKIGVIEVTRQRAVSNQSSG